MTIPVEAIGSLNALIARQGETPAPSVRPPIFKVVGIVLAIASGLFIGVSFVIKKVGLLQANKKYKEEAGEGYGYLKNWYWWGGMILMIIGEICNFVAYAFVDAILVTPLGALAVVVTTILSAIFLKERLSFVGKVGCFNCIVGSVVIVINAPEQSAVANINDMKRLVIAPGFLSYAGVVIAGSIFIALWAGPRYGKKSMMVYLTICSLIGGLSVVATQGLGAAIITQIGGTAQFNSWFIYVLLIFVIATLLTEIIYLNKALNLFNAALVTPTYYVFFTSSTIVTSAILFQGFKGTPATIATVIMGFLQICTGVILLQLSKSAKDVPDAAVFKGDLDQVRTVAEQPEPEYEPRADTIRGGGAILRSISQARNKRQMQEVTKLQEEHMQPIGENEQVEWDGLRRRKTVVEPGQSSLRRAPTLHPPLGMTHFPDPDDHSDTESMHPGFFARLRSRSRGSSTPAPPTTTQPVAMEGLSRDGTAHRSTDGASDADAHHTHGPPTPLRKTPIVEESDTTYHSPSAIQWASAPDVSDPHTRSTTQHLAPQPHTARRQFSFQNPFHRRRTSSGASRPETARSAFSFGAGGTGGKTTKRVDRQATEEERLGLVVGDSATGREERLGDGDAYEDEDDSWEGVSPVRSQAGHAEGSDGPGRSVLVGRRGTVDTLASEEERREREAKDVEKGGSGSRAFL